MGHKILFTYKKEVVSNFEYYYNWYAANGDTDGDFAANTSIANTGWKIPHVDDYVVMTTYLDPATSGGKCKIPGFTYWESPNTGATNEANFNGRGVGIITYTGGTLARTFIEQRFWTSRKRNDNSAGYHTFLNSSSASFFTTAFASGNFTEGNTVRLVKETPTISELALPDFSEADPYIGNDGTIYTTVKIGTQVWLSQDLKETKYYDGSDIPFVTDPSIWISLTYGAYTKLVTPF